MSAPPIRARPVYSQSEYASLVPRAAPHANRACDNATLRKVQTTIVISLAAAATAKARCQVQAWVVYKSATRSATYDTASSTRKNSVTFHARNPTVCTAAPPAIAASAGQSIWSQSA